ncbi:MAG: DUF554 domain-containing protein [Chitinispirillales bacterium]|jgi:uncharacterized membrane protein YqgA involved in biofilm formation|nr:DUF554 domain-containing protein [Chitinispirillales bacterium]
MEPLWGTIVNALAIVLGSFLGMVLPRMSGSMRTVIMQGLGLAVVFLGFSMGLKADNHLLIIISLVTGGFIGEILKIDMLLQAAGERLERAVKRISPQKQSKDSIAEGFATATLVFCVGAMAILGAIESGLRNDHTILYTKSMLDGISSVVFASTLGLGVIFSSLPLLTYQGTIALCAKFITSFLNAAELNAVITEVSSVGGVLIAAIGINMLKIKNINAVNLLPSVFVIALLTLLNVRFGWL